MANFKVGDVVKFSAWGNCECLIVGIRSITRGRYAGVLEYNLAPLEKDPKYLGVRVRGTSLLSKSKRRVSKARKAAITKEHTDGVNKKETAKIKRAGRGSNRIDELGIKAGVEVLINYSDGKAWERVEKVNYATGKFAVKRVVYENPFASKPDEFSAAALEIRAALGLRGPSKPRKFRWFHPDCVLEVRKPKKAKKAKPKKTKRAKAKTKAKRKSA